jgi:hypothetical protein
MEAAHGDTLNQNTKRVLDEVRIWLDASGLVKTTAVSSYLAKQRFLEPQISFNDVIFLLNMKQNLGVYV